jgi:hypothetical protein
MKWILVQSLSRAPRSIKYFVRALKKTFFKIENVIDRNSVKDGYEDSRHNFWPAQRIRESLFT